MTRVMSEEEKELRQQYVAKLVKKIYEACVDPNARLVALIVDYVDPNNEGGGIVDLTHNCANSDADVFESIRSMSEQILERINTNKLHTVQ